LSHSAATCAVVSISTALRAGSGTEQNSSAPRQEHLVALRAVPLRRGRSLALQSVATLPAAFRIAVLAGAPCDRRFAPDAFATRIRRATTLVIGLPAAPVRTEPSRGPIRLEPVATPLAGFRWRQCRCHGSLYQGARLTGQSRATSARGFLDFALTFPAFARVASHSTDLLDKILNTHTLDPYSEEGTCPSRSGSPKVTRQEVIEHVWGNRRPVRS
jgi:hypothetical protein